LDKIKAANVNKLLLDPSREGANAVLECLQYSDLEKIVYVSCNPQSWVHDCALIMANGFTLEQVQSFDMFKGTTHTELLSVFIR
jgi:23S rRNA (uracil1939-C5)-methyltransferase